MLTGYFCLRVVSNEENRMNIVTQNSLRHTYIQTDIQTDMHT